MRCIDNLCNGNENSSKTRHHEFRNLLNISTIKSFFTFSNKWCEQIATGSLLIPAFANILCVISKNHGFEVSLIISNMCSIYVILMTYLHSFLLLKMQLSLSFCYLNIPNILTREKNPYSKGKKCFSLFLDVHSLWKREICN